MIKTKLITRLQDPYIAAASGLIIINNCFYMVSDDENGLFSMPMSLENGRYIRIFSRELPEEHKARKKLKPDFEALVHLEKKEQFFVFHQAPNLTEPKRPS